MKITMKTFLILLGLTLASCSTFNGIVASRVDTHKLNSQEVIFFLSEDVIKINETEFEVIEAHRNFNKSYYYSKYFLLIYNKKEIWISDTVYLVNQPKLR